MPGKMAKSAPRPAFGLPEGPKICLMRKTSRSPPERASGQASYGLAGSFTRAPTGGHHTAARRS